MDSEVNPKLSDAKKKKSKTNKLVDDERKKIFQDRISNTYEGPFIPGPDDLKPMPSIQPPTITILGTGVGGAGGGKGPWGKGPVRYKFKMAAQGVNAITIMKTLLTKTGGAHAAAMAIKKPTQEEMFGNIDSLFKHHDEIEKQLALKEQQQQETAEKALSEKLAARKAKGK